MHHNNQNELNPVSSTTDYGDISEAINVFLERWMIQGAAWGFISKTGRNKKRKDATRV